MKERETEICEGWKERKGEEKRKRRRKRKKEGGGKERKEKKQKLVRRLKKRHRERRPRQNDLVHTPPKQKNDPVVNLRNKEKEVHRLGRNLHLR